MRTNKNIKGRRKRRVGRPRETWGRSRDVKTSINRRDEEPEGEGQRPGGARKGRECGLAAQGRTAPKRAGADLPVLFGEQPAGGVPGLPQACAACAGFQDD